MSTHDYILGVLLIVEMLAPVKEASCVYIRDEAKGRDTPS